MAFLVAGVGGGFIVLVHQALGFFRTDVWSPVSVVTGLQWLQLRWAFLPREWRGFHEFLGHLPLALTLAVLGVLGALSLRSRA